MEKITNVGSRLHNPVVGGALTGANEIKDDTKGKMQNVINQETDAELLRLDGTKQEKLTFDQTPTEGSTNPVTSGGVYAADEALQQVIEAILLLIPSAASALNQLADKSFVNSSIATATATFRGTYNSVTDLHLAIDATHQQIADALMGTVATADNNDYCYVQVPVSATSFDIRRTERYKFNGTAWAYEYDLNTSGYTAAQWAAINSGITQALVGDLVDIKSYIPSEATSLNKLADKAYVVAQILAGIPAFKGQFTTLAELQAVSSPKAGDIGIVRTKDYDGYDVFTFYQYLNSQWNVYYTIQRHPQVKPATTGTTGNYPYNGMGRVVIPKKMVEGVNTLTHEAFEDSEGNDRENTIYVIQYDFTLGENITVPANCVLEFDGGSLNGNGENKNTITADKTLVIKSGKKCFINILFSGDCCDNNYHSKWFTIPSLAYDKTYNHTTELQSMFDCGAHNFIIDGGFYYVTQTITIRGAIDIYTEFDNIVAQYYVDKTSMPIIYSDQVVTIINYEFSHSDRNKRGTYIGAIHLVCEKDYSVVTAESVKIPVLKIDSKGMMWRADIYASVNVKVCSVTQNNKTKPAYNYTGIELCTSEGNRYMTMIRLFGDIYNTYNAYITTNNGAWFTGIEIFGNTMCIKGIDTDIDPLLIHGIHQKLETFEIFGHSAYFYGNNIIDDSYVFDIGIVGDPDLVSVNTKCIASGVYNGNMQYSQNTTSSTKMVHTTQRYPQGVPVLYTPLADNNLWNFLSILTTDEGNATNPNLCVWSYKVNDIDIFSFTDGDVYNIDKLFIRDIRFYGSNVTYGSNFEDVAFIAFSGNNMLQKIEFEFSVGYAYLEYYELTNDILFRLNDGSISSCILNIYDNNNDVIDTINIIPNITIGFFNRVCTALYGGYDFNVHFKFTVTYQSSPSKVTLPYFGLTTAKNLRELNSLNSKFRLPRLENRRRVGFNYFDSVLGKVVYWTGTNWVDATGTPV